MGILDKAIDKVAKLNNTYIPYDQLADMVEEKFIKGASEKKVQEVLKIAKGSMILRSITSDDGKYEFSVSSNHGFGKIISLIFPRRDIDINEVGTKNYFTLDKPGDCKKFYNALKAKVDSK